MARQSIKTKLVLLIEASLVVSVMVVGVVSFFLLQSVFRERILAQLQSVTVLKESRVNNFIEETKMQIEYMATNPMGGRVIEKFFVNSSNQKEVVEYFDNLKKGTLMFKDFMLIDLSGEVVFSTEERDEGKVKRGEAFFDIAVFEKKSEVQDVSYDHSLEQASMMVGTPVLSATNGEVVGVLAGRVNVAEISKIMMERSGLGSTGESVIVNANNLVMTDLLKEPGSVMKKTLFSPQIKQCLLGQTVAGEVIDYHGDSVYGHYLWSDGLRACIATKVDKAEVFGTLNRMYMIMFGVMIGAAMIAGVVGYLVSRSLFGPLQSLRSEVQKVKEGNFEVMADSSSNDEIGEVAESFNEMAAKLKVSYGELEKRVKEKTKSLEEKLDELEKMNKLMVGREIAMYELKKKLKDKKNGKS